MKTLSFMLGLVLLSGGCATQRQLRELEERIAVATMKTALSAIKITELSGGWNGVDLDGDGDFERLWNDHGEKTPDGEPGPDIMDEVYEDTDNDGKWDIWYDDTVDDDPNGLWEHWKKDSNKDGQFDKEWRKERDDANNNGWPDEGEWKDMTPENPRQPHPRDPAWTNDK